MSISKKFRHKIPLNFSIIFILIGILFFINPISWSVFFDSDGHLSKEYQNIFILIDTFLLFNIILLYFLKFNLIMVNYIALFLGLIIIEVIFGNWFFEDNLNLLNILKNVTKEYSIHDLYKWNSKSIVYKRDNYGFRGKYSSLKDIDIITMGGSTTDQRYISEGFTYQDVLIENFRQNGKRINIVNAGIDGQSSVGHIKCFDLWFNKIPQLKAKYILVFIGINDMYVSSGWSTDIMINENSYNKTFSKYIIERSALFYLYKVISGLNKMEQVGHKKQIFDSLNWTHKLKLKDHKKFIQIDLENYENRLKILVEKIENFGSKPIFVTQSERRLYDFIDDKLIGVKSIREFKGKVVNGTDYYQLIRLMNEKTRKVAEEFNCIFIDLENELEFNIRDEFYDHCHHKPSGAKKIGDYLYIKLKNIFK